MAEQMANLALVLNDQEGSLERLLGRIRRRGFRIDSMVVSTEPSNRGYRLDLTVIGERCFRKLARHLLTNCEVHTVRLRTTSQAVVFSPEFPSSRPVLVSTT